MKFTARGKVNDSQSAVNVIVAFFKNFNKDSYVGIKNGNIELEIVFEEEKLPEEIATALSSCDELVFTYGQPSDNSDLEVKKESNSEIGRAEVDEIATGTEVTEEQEKSETKDENSEKKEEVHTLDSELNALAEDSETFEEFLLKIGEYIKIGKRKSFFEEAVSIAVDNSIKTWKEIYKFFDERNISYGQWESAQLNSKLSKKFGSLYIITSIEFVNKVAAYKINFFEKKEIATESIENSQENNSLNEEEEANKEEVIPKKRMKHMPEIPAFEAQLAKMDKNKTRDEKVEYVLALMGWGLSKNSHNFNEMQNIAKIAKKAVELQENDITNVIMNTDIFEPDVFTLRMQFSSFINDFVKKFHPKTQIYVSNFLADLIEIVQTENN